MTRIPCPSEAWDHYYRDHLEPLELEEEAGDFVGPIQMFECPKHPGRWTYDPACDSCLAEDLAETDRLVAEAKARGEL